MIRLAHAYRQAPWRMQRQMVGTVLAIVVFASMVAALYLSVTARTAILGREVQSLEMEIAAVQRENADLKIELARLRSTAEMERRARALGFYPAEPEDLEYVVVPGYRPPEAVVLATESSAPAVMLVPREYSQSLLDWFLSRLQETSFAGTRASRR